MHSRVSCSWYAEQVVKNQARGKSRRGVARLTVTLRECKQRRTSSYIAWRTPCLPPCRRGDQGPTTSSYRMLRGPIGPCRTPSANQLEAFAAIATQITPSSISRPINQCLLAMVGGVDLARIPARGCSFSRPDAIPTPPFELESARISFDVEAAVSLIHAPSSGRWVDNSPTKLLAYVAETRPSTRTWFSFSTLFFHVLRF